MFVSLKLNLGCGGVVFEGWVNIDRIEDQPYITYWDLETGLSFVKDCDVEEVYASHLIEHINNTILLWNEMWRVCKPNAKLLFKTPLATSEDYWSDPTHVRGYVRKTFENIAHPNINMKHYGFKTRFEITDFKIDNNEIKCVMRCIK